MGLGGLLVGYLYYSQFYAGPDPVITPLVPSGDQLSKFKNQESFDFGLFEQPYFRALKKLGDVPVQPGPAGRKADPFAP